MVLREGIHGGVARGRRPGLPIAGINAGPRRALELGGRIEHGWSAARIMGVGAYFGHRHV